MTLKSITNHCIPNPDVCTMKTINNSEFIKNVHHNFGPFTLKSRLGSGTFGQVFEGFRRNKFMAIKITAIEDMKNIEDTKDTVGCETCTWIAANNHRNIVKLFCTTRIDSTFVFCMEAATGDLRTFLRVNGDDHERIHEQLTKNIIWQLLCGVLHLHSRNVCHRDLKPENVLVSGGGRILITDFGWSKLFTDKQKMFTVGGSAEFLAPEILRKCGYTASVDNWAVGMIMFECLTGTNYFLDRMTRSTRRSYTLKKNFLQKNLSLFRSITKSRFLSTSSVSPLASSVLSKLLHSDPDMRLGYSPYGSFHAEAQLKMHPFFHGMPASARLPFALVKEMENVRGSRLSSDLKAYKKVDEWRKNVLPSSLVNAFDEFEYENDQMNEDHTSEVCLPKISGILPPQKVELPKPLITTRIALKRKNGVLHVKDNTQEPEKKVEFAKKEKLVQPSLPSDRPKRTIRPPSRYSPSVERPAWRY